MRKEVSRQRGNLRWRPVSGLFGPVFRYGVSELKTPLTPVFEVQSISRNITIYTYVSPVPSTVKHCYLLDIRKCTQAFFIISV